MLKIILISLCLILSNCSSNQTENSMENSNRGLAAFNGQYDGPPIHNVDRRDRDRRPPSIDYCGKYANDTARHVLACQYGVEEALNMAQKYAGGHGKEEGYIKGYAWGLNKMVRIIENDPNEIRNGENLVENYNSALANALSQGENSGERDGKSLGEQEAKARFYNSVNTNKIPSTNISLPSVNYEGVKNASDKYIGSVPNPEEILNNSRFGKLNIYSEVDRDYMRDAERRERRSHDIWYKDGNYNHENSKYFDGVRALKMWADVPSRNREKFNSLNATPRNENNRNRKREENVVVTQGTPVPTPPVEVTVNYQEIFNQAFVKAYESYAPIAYNSGFYHSIDNGQREGEAIGYEVGREIAQKKGLIKSFNRQYQELSKSSYFTTFSKSFTQGFSDTYTYYKNNAIITLDFLDINGEVNDGIIQPNENFSVQFKITNVGGQAGNLNYTVEGSVTDTKKFNDVIPAISSKIINSKIIGTIDPRLENDQDARIKLNVNGLQESLNKSIKRPVVINDFSHNLSVYDGSGMFNVILKNISTVAANGNIKLELKIDGKIVKTVIGDSLNPGEKKNYILDFSTLDPLIWINKSYQIEVQLKYNDMIYAQRNFELTENGNLQSLSNYFDRILNDKALLPNGKNLNDRVNEIKNFIISANNNEVSKNRNASGNVYKDDPENTIPGYLLKIKNSRSVQSAKAQLEYENIAMSFAKNSKQFKSFLGIHPKRSAYLNILTKIAGRKIK